MPDPTSQPWWRVFFGHVDSLFLSCFPGEEETEIEIAGLQRMLRLTPQDHIADVCCGMGRHLLPLVSQGYDVVGLDTSDMMLDLASLGAAEAELSVRLVQGAAQLLPFADASFDVILNLFNSFGYLDSEADDQRVLAEAARCLKPGGRFLLDTRNKKYQILYAPYHQAVTLQDGREFVLRCTYHRETERLESCWYDADDQSKLVHRASIHLYSPAHFRTMLEAVGLRVKQAYGNYEGDVFEGWERQLPFVCEKL
jgi:ubiquinone/menaquinone biosynthesis C-methylase UbiE